MKSAAPPPLNALRAFEAFARHGGMTAAAVELCVTHGAVSRQVAALQDHLGVGLVTGPRHRLSLTPAGTELAARLSDAFSIIGAAVQTARGDARREIEISCLGTLALKWLIPRLPGFVAAHPDIRVRVSESWAAVDFGRDRADGAIRILNPGQVPPGQEITPFLPQFQGPVGAPGLTPPGITVEAMARLPRLHAATFRESWAVWADLVGVPLPDTPLVREFSHNHSMIEAAAAGMGVAIAPWAFVAPDIEGGRLVAPFGFAERPSTFVFLRPQGRPDPSVDAFRDWLVAEGSISPGPPIPWTDPAAGTRRPPRPAARPSTG
ncbi:MAG: LysR substrate-binding domain-containing protein [Brevundimonas sp.]|uniref:LysR substrate-binding domain-containing protein n=1 Tax=Brevundimonas sp. TaxID=1871086 RepID=UPI002736A763|nr:LysR substrate-binding domain-containing protein [Brevundimonas sp.]MDP3406059.1 LysR substrate-binding domain-containing protein [Brevundimonas sp.]